MNASASRSDRLHNGHWRNVNIVVIGGVFRGGGGGGGRGGGGGETGDDQLILTAVPKWPLTDNSIHLPIF